MSDVEKGLAGWTHYWNANVAETFGGKEELEKNPKYLFEEKPIADAIPQCYALLDAGCGVGRYTPLVIDKCERYVGVDYSENMLAQARKNAESLPGIGKLRAMFVQAELETADFKRICIENVTPREGKAVEKFDIGMLIAIIRHLPCEKGVAVLKHVADACDILFFTATIVPPEREIPMIVKGLGDNKIVDHPYHLADLKKALGTDSLNAVPIGDRDPTEGDRYLFRYPFDASLVPAPIPKPYNRIGHLRRAIHG